MSPINTQPSKGVFSFSCNLTSCSRIGSGLFQILLPQGDGDDGGCTGGQQDAQRKDHRREGHGQIDGRQRVFPHAPGDEHAVHHGVQGENPHGHNGWDHELEETFDQIQGYDLLISLLS